MFGNCKKTRRPIGTAVIEAVESRTMLSTTPATTSLATTPVATMSPGAIYLRSAVTSASTGVTTTVTGYTPAEIRTAYGFDSASFSNGTVAADGAGQTIAIVDAFNDPNIRADLAVFDAQFGIAAPGTFDVVNQTGGTNLPANNADWAGEISLDVEWAHAIAPGANILLVEASSDDTSDLITAVNYARAAANVSVVSMSWGGSEYESWGGGGESSTQTNYDTDFTTPSGHRGVTFVAAAGDSGQQDGVQWPASSPDVVSVGGTSLTTEDDGTYVAESGWSGTSSGYSQVEAEPTYQDAVQSTGSRSVADVSYDGDPDTGFAVYDTVPDTVDNVTTSGWQEVGGTSAGSPQWAALIAIANQGRSIAGLTSLDGVTQTLPDLYSLYAAYGTTGYSTYTSYFNDVTSGGSGGYGGGHHGPPGSSSNSATNGYDVITGLGSPKAAAVIDDLATSAAVTGGSGSTGGTGGTGSGGTTSSTTTLSPVAVSVLSSPLANVIGGSAGLLKVRLANTSSTTFSGPITVTLFTSTDGTSEGEQVTALPIKSVKLRSGASRMVTLKFDYPVDLTTGAYHLIASAAATSTTTQATVAASSAVTITAPSVDLSVAFANAAAVAVVPDRNGKVSLRIENLGNVVAKGTVTITLTAVSTADGSSEDVALPVTRKVKIAVGKTIGLALPFTPPADLGAGTYTLVATITSSTTPADGDTANDTASTMTD